MKQKDRDNHEELQLTTQILIKYSSNFDEVYDSKVSVSDMDIYCTINKSRIIVNVITVRNLLSVYT